MPKVSAYLSLPTRKYRLDGLVYALVGESSGEHIQATARCLRTHHYRQSSRIDIVLTFGNFRLVARLENEPGSYHI